MVVVIAGAVIAYNHLKRPGDVSDSNAPFKAQEAQVVRNRVEWPVYGYDAARSRFLFEKGIKPPFRKLWQFGTNGVLTEFSPVVAAGTVFLADNHAHAYAFNSVTGEMRWQRKVGTLSAASPAYHDRRVFFVTLEPQRIVALDYRTGKKLWERDLPGRSESSPVVEDGKVIFGCESGDVFALNEGTGKTVWQHHVSGAVKGGVAIDGGLVFAGDYSGHLTALRLEDGSQKWQSSSLGLSLGREGAFYSTPAVAFGRVYIGSKDSRMYSFVEDTGKIAWSHSTGGEIYAAPAVAQTKITPPTVYFGGLDSKVYALDAKTGKERWTRSAGGSVIGAGSVIGQIFYVSNVSKRITAGFSTKTGKRVYGSDFGAYNPAVSDGRRVYLTDYAGVVALKPRPASAQVTKKQKQQGKQAAEKQHKQNQKKKKKKKKKEQHHKHQQHHKHHKHQQHHKNKHADKQKN